MLRLKHIRFACADPAALARFWSTLLGYEAGSDRGRVVASDPRGEGPSLAFDRLQKSPTIEVPIHLDVNVPDRAAEVDRALEVGAHVVETKTSAIGEFSETFTVMRDPEGNGFCIQSPDPRKPHPYIGNVTFSCPEPRRVVGPFWSQALGWPEQEIGEDFLQMLRAAGVDVDVDFYAFYAILSADGTRPRFLFQRRERSRPEVYPLQLEFTSDDVESDVERLTATGATLVETHDGTSLLRDPDGNPFTVE
jgi:predicted enzyme related to lactoylglutathione lyase